jgi:hypothetical protein
LDSLRDASALVSAAATPAGCGTAANRPDCLRGSGGAGAAAATSGAAGAAAAAATAGVCGAPPAASSAGSLKSGLISCLNPTWMWFMCAASVK